MGTKTMTYIEAINAALVQELEHDKRVFIIGEDIGLSGGVFKATHGLLDRFGPERVIDAPLAEGIIIGASLGAAMMGMRPIPEIQFADFITPAMDEIVQNAAKLRYRSAGLHTCPIVVRICCGGGVGGALYHSQENAVWFVHEPGLKVILPATPYDAKGMLAAAVDDPNPVLYFEHKKLYRSIRGEVPEERYTVPIGKAEIRREGSDMTAISYGYMLHETLKAAVVLAERGVSVEVIDLRTLLPIDRETILNSVRKTNKAIVVHEDKKTMGIGAELSAIITEEAFDWLDAPVVRLCGPDIPAMPFSPPLEKFFMLDREKIIPEMERLAAY